MRSSLKYIQESIAQTILTNLPPGMTVRKDCITPEKTQMTGSWAELMNARDAEKTSISKNSQGRIYEKIAELAAREILLVALSLYHQNVLPESRRSLVTVEDMEKNPEVYVNLNALEDIAVNLANISAGLFEEPLAEGPSIDKSHLIDASHLDGFMVVAFRQERNRILRQTLPPGPDPGAPG